MIVVVVTQGPEVDSVCVQPAINSLVLPISNGEYLWGNFFFFQLDEAYPYLLS